MPRNKSPERTRQLYASIPEDLYLSVKARATELRMPLRAFIEIALEQALSGPDRAPDLGPTPSLWDDEYLHMQSQQPLGSPVELSRDEAERVVRQGFNPQ